MLGQQTAIEQTRQQLKRILKAGDRHIRNARRTAVLDQAMLGKDKIDLIGSAEVRRTIADQQGLGATGASLRHAGALAGTATATLGLEWRGKLPLARGRGGGKVIGRQRKVIQTITAEDAMNGVIQTVADNTNGRLQLTSASDERREGVIDPQAIQVCIQLLLTHIQQGHLPAHALARTDAACTPVLFERFPPRAAEAVKQRVDHVLDRDSAVKVAQDVPGSHACHSSIGYGASWQLTPFGLLSMDASPTQVSQISGLTGYAYGLHAFMNGQPPVHDSALRNPPRTGCLSKAGWRMLPALALTLLVGCSAAPLPALKPPVPQAWRNASTTAANPAVPDLRNWWLAFNDPALNALVERATKDNLDVAAASERLLAARTLYDHSNDKYLPSLRGDTNQVIQPDASASYFIAGFDALWEVPLFGALKSTHRLANGNLDAARAQLQGAYVTLVADVVRCWIELRTAQEQARLLSAVHDANGEKLRLLQVRAQLKLVSPVEVAAAQAELARSDVALSGPQRDINANAQQLAVLLGQSEPDPAWLEEGGNQPQLGDWQITSAPADMLRTRPEIAAAEADVLRAAGDAGMSRADIYPHIGLGSSLDWSLNILHHHRVIRSGEGIFSLGPVVDMPLFDWGSRVAQAHAKDHELRAAVFTYRQAVLQGVAESETAMSDLQQLHLREVATEQEVQALNGNADALDKRRSLGLSSTLEWQDALIAQQNAQLELVSARAERDLAYVSLYKALGGAPLPPVDVAADYDEGTHKKAIN